MNNDEKLKIIKEKLLEFSFLKGIEPERLDQLCEKTDIIDIKAGSIMLRKGEPCHKGLYLVYEGKILIENPDQDTSYTVEKGEVVGITAFMGRMTYAITATCIEDSELIFLPDI